MVSTCYDKEGKLTAIMMDLPSKTSPMFKQVLAFKFGTIAWTWSMMRQRAFYGFLYLS